MQNGSLEEGYCLLVYCLEKCECGVIIRGKVITQS